jgi:hypothetical protein
VAASATASHPESDNMVPTPLQVKAAEVNGPPAREAIATQTRPLAQEDTGDEDPEEMANPMDEVAPIQKEDNEASQFYVEVPHVSLLANRNVSVLPTFKAITNNKGSEVVVEILFDTGSTDTYITESAVSRLKLEVIATTEFNRSTLDGNNRVHLNVVSINLRSLTEHFNLSVLCCVVPTLVQVPGFNPFIPGDLRHLKLGQIYPTETIQIDILLGMDSGVKILKQNMRVAHSMAYIDTHFGHLAFGLDKMAEAEEAQQSQEAAAAPAKRRRLGKHSNKIVAAAARLGIDLIAERKKAKADIISRSTGPKVAAAGVTAESEHDESVLVTNSELNEQLSKFWDLEHLGIDAIPRSEESRFTLAEDAAILLLKEGTEFKNGRYTLPLLWNSTDRPANNWRQARMRLASEEKRLKRKPDLLKAYNEEIAKLVEQGSCKKVNPKAKEDPECYFLPHRPIVKPGAKSSKVRPVFDASSKDRHGRSLNSMIYPGPKKQRELPGILLRFRMGKIVVAADIKKMFHQFQVREEDRKFQRFLWRDGEDDREPDIYEFDCLVFGTTDAPFKSIQTTDDHVGSFEKEYPETVDSILENIFVDDVLEARGTVDDAWKFITEAKAILAKGSLHLYKFVSNSAELLQRLSPDERGSDDILTLTEFNEDEEDNATSALGVQYAPRGDCFQFKGFEVLVDEKTPTKRTITSKMARLWDPMGYIGPFSVRAKLIARDCWLAGTDWDEKPPDDVIAKWDKWLSEVQHLKNISIPRNVDTHKEIHLRELHCLTDASMQAMCACVYLRTVYQNNEIEVRLLMAKTRVAPIKTQTLPRLELIGCVMGARLSEYVSREIKFDPKATIFWSDSKTALQWINKEAASWKCFVAARVRQIQELTEAKQWNHVAGVLNSSDMGSRGFPIQDLYEKTFWFHGPEFLSRPEDEWPKNQVVDEELTVEAQEDRGKLLIALAATKQEDSFLDELLGRTSKFWTMVHVVAYCRRSWLMLKPKADRQVEVYITWKEEMEAITRICSMVQREAFPREWEILKNEECLKDQFKLSKLVRLDAFYDKVDKVLRVGGRLKHAQDLTEEEKHPIVLPANHEFVVRLIVAFHAMFQHAPKKWTRAYLLDYFHILRADQAIDKALKKCAPCRRHNAKPLEQKMADLPEERLKLGKLWNDVGMDLAGPIEYLDDQKTKTKSWIVVYTCLTSRGVVLDFIPDMTTESIIQSVWRLIARRGAPKQIISDCAANFVKASKEMKALWDHVDWEKIQETRESGRIEWKFISPKAPWQGGIWESVVKMLKQSLRRTISGHILFKMELVTVIFEIEAQINSRPLTAVTTDYGELEGLTPAMMLFGYNPKPYPDIMDFHKTKGTALKVRWKKRQIVSKHFWNCWKKQYLRALQVRSKWYTAKPDVKVGQVVLIFLDKQPRLRWPLGIVEEIIKGRDERVRKVMIRTKSGLLERAIQHVYPLEDDSVQQIEEATEQGDNP